MPTGKEFHSFPLPNSNLTKFLACGKEFYSLPVGMREGIEFLPACRKFRQIRVRKWEGTEIPSRSATVLNYIRMMILIGIQSCYVFIGPLMEMMDTKIFKDTSKHYDDKLALASLIIHSENVTLSEMSEELNDKIFEWCEENEDKLGDSEIQAIINKFKSNLRKQELSFIEEKMMEDFPMENHELRNLADIFAFESEDLSLQNKLKHVWDKFLEFVNQLKITDFLNFTIIAKILEELAKQYENRPHRTMLKTLSEGKHWICVLKSSIFNSFFIYCLGKPNLIVVPEKEIHAMCLVVYANDLEKPLPSKDEVIICTPNTSSEQLENFLLR